MNILLLSVIDKQFSEMLSDISVKVILHEKAGLLGAARKALGKG